ncbi:hypothetical protein [Fructilactobacillus florum]
MGIGVPILAGIFPVTSLQQKKPIETVGRRVTPGSAE